MARITRKLTVFDIFLILVILVGITLVGIKFLTSGTLTLKGTRPIEITFIATNVPAEIASQIKDGEELLVNNFFFGQSKDVRIQPDLVENPDDRGNLVVSKSNLNRRVYVSVETEAVEGTNGFQRGNVKINIGENYFIYVGSVKLQGKIIEIRKE
jgi:hypothetical protein